MDPKCVFVRVWWGITWTPSVFTFVCVCGVYMFGAPWVACQRAVSIRFICFLKFSVGRSGRGDSIPRPAAMPPKKSWKEKAVPKAMKAKKKKARKVKVPKAMKAKKKKIIDRIPAFDNGKRLRKRREWPSVQPMKVINEKWNLKKYL